MTRGETTAAQAGHTTAWARAFQTPLREFLRTETGSSVVLLVAAVLALVWINVDPHSYDLVWETRISLQAGDLSLAQDLRDWINTGLMTFFFLVFGLEARREFDVGELRERRRLTVPVAAGMGGMLVPIAIYLAFNAGRPSIVGWGAVMATDTAFALAMLALVGPRLQAKLRAFMLTIFVVDDVTSLGVIALGYTERIAVPALLVAAAAFGVVLLVRAVNVHHGLVYAALGAVIWLALFQAGVEPVVTGLVMGLVMYAYPASRTDLERATTLFRRFREQPTPEFARTARLGVGSAISPNERFQVLFHPWTSYLIVPLFALANVGVEIDPGFLVQAYTSPITLGILVGFVVGKPIGITGASWLVSRVTRGGLRPPVGWASLASGSSVAALSFTLSLFIATLAFEGRALDEAKIGILSAAVAASLLGWCAFQATKLLPPSVRARAIFGTTEGIIDLAVPVDPERDHIRGPADAPVTIVEYGDFECPNCGQAESAIRELLAGEEVRYVWRHLPLNDVHPHAQLAAEASEIAAKMGKFWEMHDLLLDHQDQLTGPDLVRHAESLGLDGEVFVSKLRKHAGAPRVAEDVDSADLSDVSGTPTFFINGRRHHGAYDIEALALAVRAARIKATLQSS